MINISELRELSFPELDEKRKDFKKELLNLRFQKAKGELKNSAQFSAVRKSIARIETVKQEREKNGKGGEDHG